MVTPSTIGPLLRCINLSSCAVDIRGATADTLVETVLKGMPAPDKLRPFEVLDVGSVLAALLLNGLGTKLCKIIDDTASAPEAKLTAHGMTASLLPLLLRFLVYANDDISLAVYPFATAVLSVFKKAKRRASADAGLLDPSMTEPKRHGPEAGWEVPLEGGEDKEALRFVEMRQNFGVMGSGIAWSNLELCTQSIAAIIAETFNEFKGGGTW
ncbi:pre-tRNA nuclear export protein [Rhodotorula kratochvilovae]